MGLGGIARGAGAGRGVLARGTGAGRGVLTRGAGRVAFARGAGADRDALGRGVGAGRGVLTRGAGRAAFTCGAGAGVLIRGAAGRVLLRGAGGGVLARGLGGGAFTRAAGGGGLTRGGVALVRGARDVAVDCVILGAAGALFGPRGSSLACDVEWLCSGAVGAPDTPARVVSVNVRVLSDRPCDARNAGAEPAFATEATSSRLRLCAS